MALGVFEIGFFVVKYIGKEVPLSFQDFRRLVYFTHLKKFFNGKNPYPELD